MSSIKPNAKIPVYPPNPGAPAEMRTVAEIQAALLREVTPMVSYLRKEVKNGGVSSERVDLIEAAVAAIQEAVDALEAQPKVVGGNIYIQNTEPIDQNCVWIDTNGIDLILG
jgi:hypothetical protein